MKAQARYSALLCPDMLLAFISPLCRRLKTFRCSEVKQAEKILKRKCPAKPPGAARCAGIFIMVMNRRMNARIASSLAVHLKKYGRGNKKFIALFIRVRHRPAKKSRV